MRLPTALIILLLCLGSCQQRYAHRSRVKAKPLEQTSSPIPLKDRHSIAQFLDSLVPLESAVPGSSETVEIPQGISTDIPEESETNPAPSRPELSPEDTPIRRKIEKGFNILDDDRLTFQERLLIYCAFVFCFLIAVILATGLGLFCFWLAIALPFPSIVITAVTAGTFIIGWIFKVSYEKAERMIEDRIPDKTLGKPLGIYYTLALIITIAIGILVIIYGSLPWAIALFSLYVLGVILYLFSYKKAE